MKNNRKILFGLLTPITIVAPVFTLAASGETTERETPEKPTTPDPDFPNFGASTDQMIKDNLGKIIDENVDKLINHSVNLLKGAKEEDIPRLLTKSIYYGKIASFLKTNRDAIIENPDNFGIHIVYPHIISKNDHYKKGEVVFDGKSYDNVALGDPYDYANIANGENESVNVKEEGVVNTINLKDLNDKVDSYFNDLNLSFEEIVAHNDDHPVLDGEVNKTSILWNKEENKTDLEIPNGFTSWDDYIKDKFKKRYTAFDLSKNQENNVDPNKPKPDPKPQPETPPIIPTDPIDPPDFNLKIGKENIARLNPILRYNQVDSGPINWKTAISADRENASETYFFFDNPINTRFHYIVNSINDENKAVVTLYDVNKPANNKEYTEPVLTLARLSNESNETFYARASKYLLGREAFSNVIKGIYYKFYEALGLDENVLLTNLGHNIISSAVFNMMFDAIRIVNSPVFINERDRIIAKYANEITSPDLQANINSNFYKEIASIFLGSLITSEINQTKYFVYLGASYKELYYKYFDYIRSIEPLLVSNFEKAKLNLNDFELAMRSLLLNIDYFKGYSASITNNVEFTYNEVLKQLNAIQTQFKFLSYLTQNKELNIDNESEIQKYQEAYASLSKTPFRQPNTNKTTLQIFGATFMTIGLILLISAIILTIIKAKTKSKALKTKTIISYSISSTLMIVATILLILGGIL
ncbi:Uncharacterised protein [Metamycoplasma cloacale]|uniref:Uncharacterized protein n=1 Tax=Metamycoplasma cloacale TaxID=92401 RepID=A0A2Z4LM83_9BACT|nr:hypothetical protein [Metamycoplasma cloacale]AWX42578.1 hypothetical protein DK849_00560 [Metamycoplasma cloacale]VEU79710.1 Uncharacterised protein [Metamycoplasma cloacale]